jgi:hypothetical protein
MAGTAGHPAVAGGPPLPRFGHNAFINSPESDPDLTGIPAERAIGA